MFVTYLFHLASIYRSCLIDKTTNGPDTLYGAIPTDQAALSKLGQMFFALKDPITFTRIIVAATSSDGCTEKFAQELSAILDTETP